MHRAWIRQVGAAIGACAALAPAPALAFHGGATFDQKPGQGGGGSLYYAGAESDHGWDCKMCHVKPAGQIDLAVKIEPAPAYSGADPVYVPGTAYTFTVDLVGEHLGLARGQYNFNSLVVDVEDVRGFRSSTCPDAQFCPAGSFTGFASTDFVTPRASTLLYGAPAKPGTKQWTFKWTAPAAGSGALAFHLAGVDGDGASTSADPKATTDPVNDDVVVKTLRWKEGAATAMRLPDPEGVLAAAFGVALAGLWQRRRKSAALTPPKP